MRAVTVFLLFFAKVYSQECTLDVSDPASPMIVTLDLKFPSFSNDQSFSFKHNDLFYIMCPRGTQSPYISSETGDEAACREGTEILVISTVAVADFGAIKCRPNAVTTVTTSDEPCANNNGVMFEVGFNVSKSFLSSVKICFDKNKLTPIYCTNNHDISPTRRDADPNYYQMFVCNGTDCGWADGGSLYDTINVDDVYENQEEILKKLGIDKVESQLVKFPLTTALWHLNVANNGQQIRKAPFYDYINVVPAWNTDTFNKLLQTLDTTLGDNEFVGDVVRMGTFGVATLPNSGGDEVELFLGEGKIPVPKWIWMNYDKKEQVLFYYNHPDPDQSETAIADMCSKYNDLNTSVFTCLYESVVDPDMKNLIDNDFNNN
ncbi:hypothetical protein Zmor_022536 [Zophobas morio]|uniref:Uncharacterized protein n=2 Tax=Zophobas morio TaxID=2755281 RepID=A0AA38I160_9CUCU|nr:hypothetical protein Zmor_022536 [Zophobas morio]